MSGFKLILITFLIIITPSFSQQDAVSEIQEKQESVFKSLSEEEATRLYREAVKMYKRKSYYSALNLLTKLITHRDNIYYSDALFLTAKIYLELGRKTGKKGLIQKALNYLNKYSYTAKKAYTWDFYYTKGNIYENLYMYERALASYKLAFYRAVTKRQQFKTVAAILRTAAWTKKMDLVTRYIVLVNVEELSHEEKKEFEFIKGLLEFQKGNYEKAYQYLSKIYKEYEPYLIENPYYYFIFAENTYRTGKYYLAKQIFRRIISLIKDEEIIRRSLLRLGDIFNIKGDKITAFNYYYSIIEKYPDSREAKVAKLKILAMSDDPRIKKKIKLIEDEDFKKPLRFVYRMLVSNRNNYIGNFAFGNFGNIVLKSKNDRLFHELVKEISLIYPERMLYEHKEYINKLWKNELLDLEYQKSCELYITNKNFFKSVFDRKVLIKIVKDLKLCGKEKSRIDLAEWILKRWNDDRSRLLLAQVYFEEGMYTKSLSTLKNIKNKDCNYYKLLAKNKIELQQADKKLLKTLDRCKKDTETIILKSIISFQLGNIDRTLMYLDQVKNEIYKFYENRFYNKYLIYIVEKSFSLNRYREIFNILKPVSEKIDECDLNSFLLISAVRIGLKSIDKYAEKIKNCKTLWTQVAENIYEDYLLMEEALK
ncbi:tetratricopeptide repeat protein [Persephonella sp.]